MSKYKYYKVRWSHQFDYYRHNDVITETYIFCESRWVKLNLNIGVLIECNVVEEVSEMDVFTNLL